MTDEDVTTLIATLAHASREVEELLSRIPNTLLQTRPAADEFSAVENVCHLRDIEIEGYAVRIKRILNEDTPALADLDGGRLAVERDYNNQNANDAFISFKEARKENLSTLNHASASDFLRKGIMEGIGEVSLLQLLNMMVEHDAGHLDDLRRISRF